ncbi:hypothetical protein J5N97_010990 [Dioscorea zingiberensis]|uniref:Uncharacterized protein n=1 Tax=Dioscorea zingiberensis TaxID=325984 RepID=A0A9D5D274_9LILI|nr:hypothetical protein J5N97_010990 [Dioscorea zingiberensis]
MRWCCRSHRRRWSKSLRVVVHCREEWRCSEEEANGRVKMEAIWGVGGGRLLSREEEAEARAEAESGSSDREQLVSRYSRDKGIGKKKGKGKPFGDEEDDLGSLFGEGITGKLPRHANRITLKDV